MYVRSMGGEEGAYVEGKGGPALCMPDDSSDFSEGVVQVFASSCCHRLLLLAKSQEEAG